jgi:LAO/AO transport system kinase
LALQIRKEWKKTVGIIAIDPSSPSSGGAFMGNRIRMREAAKDSGIFIRSMASRTSPGGIPRAACDTIKILDAAGAACIILETVGAGQMQTDISRTAHTTVVVIQPESGDIIQALKAGLMEIGDIFVINKSDLPGADKTANGLTYMLATGHYGKWVPRVIKVTATSGKGVADLAKSIEEHRRHLASSGELAERQKTIALNEVEKIVEEEIRKELTEKLEKTRIQKYIEGIVARKISAYDVAMKLMITKAGKRRATSWAEHDGTK